MRISLLLLTAVAISAAFLNYGPLIPLLQSELRISSGQAGLFSTFLYGGIACSYLPGGMLADRYGSRRVLMGSLLLIGAGGCLLPLVASLPWMAGCRLLIGLGAGAAIVAGSQAAARLGDYAALGQGLNGGAMQLGAGLGLFGTPLLLAWSSWRGVLLAWGLLALLVCLLWASTPTEEMRASHRFQLRRVTHGFRSPPLLCLGLTHLGTLGLGQAVAPWLALYLAYAYGLPLGAAAMIGSIGLLAGMLFRPLGGVLVARRVFSAVSLMRVGTLLTCVAVVILALPLHTFPLVGIGMALLSFGTTIPYAAVFNEAGRVGTLSGLGTGTAQGVVSLLSAPASSLGPPLIGLLLVQRAGASSFSAGFGALALVGVLALGAALLAGPALARTTKRWSRPFMRKNTYKRSARPLAREHETRVARNRDRCDAHLKATLLHVKGRTHLRQQRLPLIAIFGTRAERADTGDRGARERAVYTAGATTIEQLLRAGGLPLLLPPPLAQEATLRPPADKESFHRAFDRLIWPFFCQLLAQQVSGICLDESLGPQVEHAAPFDRRASTRETTEQASRRLQRSIALLAGLVGIPVLGGGHEMQSVQAKDRRADTTRSRAVLDHTLRPTQQQASPSRLSAFVAACATAEPPPPEALQPLQREIGDWLFQAELALAQGTANLQGRSGQKTGRKEQPSLRQQARQQKLRDIRGRGKPDLQVRTISGAG